MNKHMILYTIPVALYGRILLFRQIQNSVYICFLATPLISPFRYFSDPLARREGDTLTPFDVHSILSWKQQPGWNYSVKSLARRPTQTFRVPTGGVRVLLGIIRQRFLPRAEVSVFPHLLNRCRFEFVCNGCCNTILGRFVVLVG